MNTLLTILGIAPFGLLVLNILKYIFLPHYRFQLGQQKLKEKSDSISKLYDSTYMKYKDAHPIPQFKLQMETDAAFGTKIYPYQLIFLLFDRDIVKVEQKAKDLMGIDLFINIDYQQNKITPPKWLVQKSLIWIFVISMIIYTIISILLLLSMTWLQSTFMASNWFILFLFIVLFIDTLVIITVGRFKSVEDLIDW